MTDIVFIIGATAGRSFQSATQQNGLHKSQVDRYEASTDLDQASLRELYDDIGAIRQEVRQMLDSIIG